MKRFCWVLVAAACMWSGSVSADHVWSDLQKGDLLWTGGTTNLWSSVNPSSPSNRIHESRFSAGNLLLAARYGLAGDPNVEKVLQALHDMQIPPYGTIKTRYEDSDGYFRDSNSSFFVCSLLHFLRQNYASELTANSIALLDNDIFPLFYVRFYDQSKKISDSVHYPNKYLGDLICAKLIQETLSVPGAEELILRNKMLEAADYWRDNNWGWGEHMSDIYASVCMDLISEYLLLTTDAPNQLQTEYSDLLEELLFIEDSFGGNPRVPAIRSYAFSGRTGETNYRDEIEAWEASMGYESNHFWRESHLIHALLYELNWHGDIEPPVYPIANKIQVPCYGGTVGTAIIEDDIRLGSMSKYPIMPEHEHETWGLLWQSFPVAFWKPDGDWAFLQWQTVESGVTKAHPANSSGGSKSLSATEPPLFGETHSFQQDGNVLTVRIMPEITNTWSSVTDQFKILDSTASISNGLSDPSFSQLLLTYPERTVSVGFSSLVDTSSVASLSYSGNAAYWGTTYSSAQLAAAGLVVDLFGISLNGEIERIPEISVIEPADPSRTLQEQKREVVWYWPNGTVWRAVVDPLAVNALQDVVVERTGLITFSDRTVVLNDAAGSSVLPNGSHVAAGNVYGGGVDPVLNGVTFEQLNFSTDVTDNGVILGVYDLGTNAAGWTASEAAAYYSASSDLAELMSKNYLGNYYADGIGISLTGLELGKEYQLQGFYWDKATGSIQYVRDAGNVENRSVTFHTSATAVGYSWTATWIADSATKSLEVISGPSSRALLAGVSLRAAYDDPYDQWISYYPGVGSETDLADNPDGDSLNNLGEWALGGNPDDPADIGYKPTFGIVEYSGDDWVEYIYAKRNDADTLGLTYYLEQNTNLVDGVWTNAYYDFATGEPDSAGPGFGTVTNWVITTVEDQQFLHLVIEHN